MKRRFRICRACRIKHASEEIAANDGLCNSCSSEITSCKCGAQSGKFEWLHED